MFFFVIALPGRFGTWCDTVAARLAARLLGPTEIIRANSLEELSQSAMRLEVLRAVAAARQAGGRLRRALTESGQNFVVAFEDPRLACAELVHTANCELAGAIKQVASGAAAVIAYRSARGALNLSAVRDWTDPIATTRAIAEHFHLPVTPRDVSEIVAEVDSLGLSSIHHDLDARWHGFSHSERAMAEAALAPYLDNAGDTATASIAWAADLFFIGDRSDRRANRPIDITGRARCLVNGPDIVLPPGTWSVFLELQFSREASEHDFLVEVVTDRQLASTIIRPHGEDRLDAELTFPIDDSSDAPVALRVSTQRAAFDGALVLHGARLLRHADPSGATAPAVASEADL